MVQGVGFMVPHVGMLLGSFQELGPPLALKILWPLEFRVYSLGFGVWGLVFSVWGLGLNPQSGGHPGGVEGLGFEVYD